MGLDIENDFKGINSTINAYKSTVVTKKTEKLLKRTQESGNNLELKKSEYIKSLSEFEDDVIERTKTEIKNQYDKLIELFKNSLPAKTIDLNNPEEKKRTDTMDFLLSQILEASQNTKSRLSEIFIEETLSVAGCSQEQTFLGNQDGSGSNKIYIRVNQIDLFKKLNKNPSEGDNDLLYELNTPVNGESPYSMDRELYNRLQNEGFSFQDEYSNDYIGASGREIMNINYVTTFTQNGQTYNGDFFEITLIDRPNNNRISDFLKDYYDSIEIINFDNLSEKIFNSLTDFMDISVGTSASDKEESSKFERIIQRILGLCFDNNTEIDVSGVAKLSAIDTLDQSFFEVDGFELRNIENDIENMINGVTEFEDCGNVKLPVNVGLITDSLRVIRRVPEGKKISKFIEATNDIADDENWKFQIPTDLNINISLKENILKSIPRAVVLTMLTPKTLLGLMTVLKSVQSQVIDGIEDLKTFMDNMKTFMLNLISKVGSIFVEELFYLLKKNLRILVENLLKDIIKESKNAKIKMITAILAVLIQLASAVIDWRQCKSVIDEILNLLNLAAAALGGRIPNFALAGAQLLPGFSETRAMANTIENLQKLGLPTGDLPDGSPNLMLPAILQQIKGVNEESVTNSKTETWCAPVPVGLVMSSFIRCSGKNY